MFGLKSRLYWFKAVCVEMNVVNTCKLNVAWKQNTTRVWVPGNVSVPVSSQATLVVFKHPVMRRWTHPPYANFSSSSLIPPWPSVLLETWFSGLMCKVVCLRYKDNGCSITSHSVVYLLSWRWNFKWFPPPLTDSHHLRFLFVPFHLVPDLTLLHLPPCPPSAMQQLFIDGNDQWERVLWESSHPGVQCTQAHQRQSRADRAVPVFCSKSEMTMEWGRAWAQGVFPGWIPREKLLGRLLEPHSNKNQWVKQPRSVCELHRREILHS